MTINILELLQIMVQYSASDLIIKNGSAPIFRINKELIRGEMEELDSELIRDYLKIICSDENYKKIIEQKEECDFSFYDANIGRFRVNAFWQKGGLAAVFRHIKSKLPTFEELLLPETIYKTCSFQNGIILITGTTGSGKSSTMAAIINYINQNFAKHIVTIEDPIEFVHTDLKSAITQREIGIDSKNYDSALRAVLRQNPDIIVIGEMRDAETVLAGVEASETGHLVLSTLHTGNASQTIDRIIEFFPKTKHDQIRTLLAENIKAIFSQMLIPKIDGSRMVPAVEIMVQTTTLKKLIRENQIEKLLFHIHNGSQDGMQTFDQSLVSLYLNKYISYEDAMKRCSRPALFDRFCQGFFPNIDDGE